MVSKNLVTIRSFHVPEAYPEARQTSAMEGFARQTSAMECFAKITAFNR